MDQVVRGTTVTRLYKCPVCRDTGTEVYKAHAPENVYGSVDWLVDMARPCSRCKGLSKFYVDTSGMPDQYSEADTTKFKFDIYKNQEVATNVKAIANSFITKFDEWQKKGKGLYIWSEIPGSGKTFLACCMSQSIALKHRDVRVKFITVPKYLELLAEAGKQERGLVNPSLIYKECEILILDDIGTQKDSKNGWEREKLFELINARSCLITIYTSNMDIGSLNIDDRTKSRILSTTINVHVPEESIRNMNAVNDNDDFIKSIL